MKNKGSLLLDGNDGTYGGVNGIALKWPEGYPDNDSPSYFWLLTGEVEIGASLAPICKSQLDQTLPPSAQRGCPFGF